MASTAAGAEAVDGDGNEEKQASDAEEKHDDGPEEKRVVSKSQHPKPTMWLPSSETFRVLDQQRRREEAVFAQGRHSWFCDVSLLRVRLECGINPNVRNPPRSCASVAEEAA
jgi:hypothetical protein